MGASNRIIRLALCGVTVIANTDAGAEEYCPRDVTRPFLRDCDTAPRAQRLPVAQQALPGEPGYGYTQAAPYPYAYPVVSHPQAQPVPPPPAPAAYPADPFPAFAAAFLLGAVLFGGGVRHGPGLHGVPRVPRR